MFPLFRVSLVGCIFCNIFITTAAQNLGESQISLQKETRKTQNFDAAAYRKYRQHYFETKLNTDETELQAQCRYESEISSPPPKKMLALTFDDGPEAIHTELILSVLKQHDIQATFFMIGEQVKKHPEIVAKVIAENRHLIANHSWDHSNFHTINIDEQIKEIEKAERALKGVMTQKFFRYPYGNATCAGNDFLHKQGYKIVGWHIDSCDWAFDKSGEVDFNEAAICGVLPQYRNDYVGHVMSMIRAHNGGIILIHELHPHTLKHLDEIIRLARADGFFFESISSSEFSVDLR